MSGRPAVSTTDWDTQKEHPSTALDPDHHVGIEVGVTRRIGTRVSSQTR